MNKRLIFCLPALLLLTMLSRAQFTENFSDGDFTANPVWGGSSADWVVNNGQLQSNNTVTNSTFYLSTPSTLAITAQWEFFINLGFNTSSANYVDVYLVASASDLSATTTTGYFVRIGGTNDEICLYKKNNPSAVLIIDGVDLSTNKSNNTIRIKVIRDASNNFTLYRDLAGGTNYTVEGTVVDPTYTTSAFFGFLVKQSTASFFSKHFFDDIVVQAYTPDITAPTIQSATAIGSTLVDVLFNEPLDGVSSQLVTNYVANNGLGSPLTAVQDGSNSSLVHLNFANTFPNGVNVQLTVNGVKDLAGNAIAGGTVSFIYFAPYVAEQYDIVIDEIMADVAPAVGLPGNEWIELRNTTTSAINLSGWRISDATGQSGPMPNFLLKPDSFVIVCASASVAAMSAFGTTISVTSFPSLNDDGDQLSLKTDLGKVIHAVKYSSAWYKDDIKKNGGWSLEMINTKAPCTSAANWKASNDVKGGTPGAKNSVDGGTADNTGPKLLSALVIDNTHIALVFDESLDSLNGATITKYSISDGIGVPIAATSVSPVFDTVKLQLGTAIISNKIYTVTATGVTDCLGNITANGTASFSLYTPRQYDVVIDEIMADPTPLVGLPDAEWIELRNTSSFSINLQGWRVGNGTSFSGAMPGITLKPDSFLIVCGTGTGVESALSAFGTTIAVTSFPSPTNDEGQLVLSSADGTIINAVKYSSTWYRDDIKKNGGWTLEMINTASPCIIGSTNWKASLDVKGGTPGEKNSVDGGTPDVSGPQLIKVTVNDNMHITLSFDESIDSLKGATISNYTVSDGFGSPQAAVTLAPTFDKVDLQFSTPLVTDKVYTITATGLTDCIGNASGAALTGTFKYVEVSLPELHDIVVNEILFDPIPTINAELPGVDYVEIYNRSNKVIDLKTVYITNRSSTTGQLGDLEQISTSTNLLFPGSFMVVTRDPTIVRRDFHAEDPAAFVTLPGMPSYSDDKGAVIIAKADGTIIDEIDYSEKWHFPLIDNPENVALERIDYNDFTVDDPATSENEQARNWHSAASSVGYGTPTYKNSQYLVTQQVEGEITITPDIVSPDNDGLDDYATLNYRFPEGGYVANITIFDASGRPVRYLQKNALCGVTGFYRWDGLGEKSQKLAIGTYIFFTEIFNLQGKKKTFKNVIVLARKY